MKKTIEIAPNELSLVQTKIAKANKKAVALGVSPVVIESTTPFVKTIKQDGKTTHEKFLRLDLSYEPLKFGEYTFVATLDHMVGTSPIVRGVPGQVVPEQYFHVASRCDHCGTDRFRKQTFLFQDANGYKLVGRSCLKDFFGIDPTKNIDWVYNSVGNIEGDFGVRGENVESIQEIIEVALVFVNRFGYVSKSKASEVYLKTNKSISTTAGDVFEIIFGSLIGLRIEEINFRKEIINESKSNTEQAQELIKWGLEHFSDKSGDYAHNMRNLLSQEYISPRYIGYVVSVIGAYNREMEQNVAKKATAYSNEYLGSVGQKLEVGVTVVKHSSFETAYGVTHLFVMADAAGNSLVWFASNNSLTVGDSIIIKGTVKAHNDREGRKQTVLTRCKQV